VRGLGAGLAAALAAAAALSSCASTSEDALAVIREQQAATDRDITHTLPEMLASAADFGLTAVEGTVTTVERGVGMSWMLDDNGENEQREILPFEDEAAMVRSVHVTMRTDRVLAGQAGAEIRFGLVISDTGEFTTMRDGLTDGDFVAILIASPVFDYEPELLGVMIDGGLLCEWNDARRLACPALEAGLAAALAVSDVSETMFAGG
jgi:hypothetical protein